MEDDDKVSAAAEDPNHDQPNMTFRNCTICNQIILFRPSSKGKLAFVASWTPEVITSLCEVFRISVDCKERIPVCSTCTYNIGSLNTLHHQLKQVKTDYERAKNAIITDVQATLLATDDTGNLGLLADCAANPGVKALQHLICQSANRDSLVSDELNQSSRTESNTILSNDSQLPHFEGTEVKLSTHSQQEVQCVSTRRKDSDQTSGIPGTPEDLSLDHSEIDTSETEEKTTDEALQDAFLPETHSPPPAAMKINNKATPSTLIETDHFDHNGNDSLAIQEPMPKEDENRIKDKPLEVKSGCPPSLKIEPVHGKTRGATSSQDRSYSLRGATSKKPKGSQNRLPLDSISSKTQRYKNSKGHYVCSFCSKEFLRMYTFWDHFKTHTGEGPSCHVCEKIFPRGHNLALHMRTHTGEKPYDCPNCQKGFTDASNLKVHMRLHTGERPYQCGVCQKGFTNSSRLAAHQLQHTGIRPFKCSQCTKSFCKKLQLQNHVQKMHTKEGLPIHHCKLCPKKYTSIYSLRVHQKRHHENSS